MNAQIIKLDLDKVLFFDAEMVSRNEELILDSMEYKLYSKKTRDRATDTPLSHEDLLHDYKEKAALKPAFNKIICISVGTILNGELVIKSFKGDEQDIVKNFYRIVKKYDYVCGYNVLGFDLPMIRIAALKTDPTILKGTKQDFNDSGKKPWELKQIVDLMDVVKGTYFYPMSMEEVCYLLEIPSSKDGGIDGSMVSKAYYDGKLDEIVSYCERDVVACVNILMALRGDKIFTKHKLL